MLVALFAPVAQWIEDGFLNRRSQVRSLSGVLSFRVLRDVKRFFAGVHGFFSRLVCDHRNGLGLAAPVEHRPYITVSSFCLGITRRRPAPWIHLEFDIPRLGRRKAIVFVTGVSGAGKTLVGLNMATRHGERSDAAHAAFLFGHAITVRHSSFIVAPSSRACGCSERSQRRESTCRLPCGR
jgi:hypothetical protein